MKRLRWLTAPGLIAIHEELIGRYGGLQGLRDAGALESAVARPRQLASYGAAVTVPDLAAAYGWGILRNHPFIDGNKRLCLAAIVVFLELNAWEWTASEVEETAMILSAAAGEVKEPRWIDWIESRCRKIR